MIAPCDIRDDVCRTHDVQAEPIWPDAMGEVMCPQASDPGWRMVHGDEQ